MTVLAADATALDALEGDDRPDDLRARVKAELAPGERLVWAGRARPRRELSGRAFATLYAVGFAVLSLVGFAGLFGHLGARLHAFEGGFALMGIGGGAIAFLIAIGVVANVIDKWSERRHLAGTLYALTDSRAITWSPSGRGVRVTSIRRGSVKEVHRVEFADGSGSVHFDSSPAAVVGRGLFDIPDARRVEALVRLHLIGDDRPHPTSI